ncbi:enolase C-terminal domain-like protein [Actinopolymorpha sp. B11F2]|uniref:enolase C-terminal domain-like protein n=1 Tax=Actinopolymorpha sp. B11F2 TaxID=3160862 RepID=UPI0032E3FDBB
MRITEVQVLHVHGPAYDRPATYRQHRMLHHYAEYAPTSEWQSGGDQPQVSAYYLRIEAGSQFGLYGPVDRAAADLVLSDLREFLIGKDPRQFSILWDQLYRIDRHARSSHPMMAISAVDNAVWDLLGRHYDASVCQLLGGPRSAEIEAYASTLGSSLAPGDAEEIANRLRGNGFRHQKWFFGYGPRDGAEGLAANVDLARRLRAAVDEDVELSFDAFMSWTVPYAREWLRRAAPYRPYWLEEPLPADQLEAMAALRRETDVPLTAGEHLYGRWEAFRYIEAGAVDVMQSDPEWCGGVTELVQICTVASLRGVPVIPHGHGVRAALHVVASRPPSVCPKIEYLVNRVYQKLHFEKDFPTPVDGRVAVGTAPGFGIELDESKIETVDTL